jgi:polar amino acid transport system ATP-binding protein
MMIVAEKLTKTYPSGGRPLTVLHEVNFQVEAEEVVAILGPSGSGKTTLLGLLAGLDRPTNGRVLLDGFNLSALTEDERAEFRSRNVGFVFQTFHLIPTLTALDNVMVPMELAGVAPRGSMRTRALGLLERVGLGDRAHHYPAQLSGGEQQRVGIARAVAMEPKIILLDEITSALDPELVGEVLAVVRSLAEDGMTMLMVTHEMAFARDASSRIVFMADGGVSAVGPPKEILAAETTNERLRTFLARFRASHF